MKNRRWVRLCVEVLEGRVVPSTVAPPPAVPAPYALWGSSNWSGIDLNTTKGAVTFVQGSWIVPAVAPTVLGPGYSSTWVGIDGDPSSTVEQLGTESDTVATSLHDGTPQYYAWYEMYPAGYHMITPYAVQAGDQMTASVLYAGQTKSGPKTNDNFILTITDSTPSAAYPTGWTFSTTQSVPKNQIAQRVSAEWIEEAPSSLFGVLPLANFGSVTFTNARATISGDNGTIASFLGKPSIINYGTPGGPLQEINIIDMGTFTRWGQWTSIKDETSLLSASGDSFTVQFGSSGQPGAPGGTPFTGGPNNRITSFEELSFTSSSSLAINSRAATAEHTLSLRESMSESVSFHAFPASDARQSAGSFRVPNQISVEAAAMGTGHGAAHAALRAFLTGFVSQNGAGFRVAKGDSSLPSGTLGFTPMAGDMTRGGGEASRSHLAMSPPSAEFGATEGLPPQYALEGPMNRSAAALLLLIGLHGWNGIVTAEDEARRNRRPAKARLPIQPA